MDTAGVSPSQEGASAESLPPVWRRREPLGYAYGLVSFASVAAPLLTGFALTTIIELTGRDDRGTRGDIAIAAFAFAAGLLIYAIQAGLAAGQLAIAPDQRAAQMPEARGYPEWMRRLREDQWRDAALAERLFIRTRIAYNLGILAFLVGLTTALLPGPGDWNPIRIAAVAAAGTAAGIELVLVNGNLGPVSHWLLPTLDSAPKAHVEAPDDKPVEMDDVIAQRLVYGDSSDMTNQQLPQANGNEVTTALTTLTAQLASLTAILARLEVTVSKGTRQPLIDHHDD
jgi:MFS family permease